MFSLDMVVERQKQNKERDESHGKKKSARFANPASLCLPVTLRILIPFLGFRWLYGTQSAAFVKESA